MLIRITKRFFTLVRRVWKIYVNPPRESKIFFDVSNAPVLSRKVMEAKTDAQPKQVVVYEPGKLAFVSCMFGRSVQVFSYAGSDLRLMNTLNFEEQCVEVEIFGEYCLLTTTNFARGPMQSSHFYVIDIKSQKIIGQTNTKGEWSKIIKVNPNKKEAAVSNWHSNNISIINILNPQLPVVAQLLPTGGEAPRGIAFQSEKRFLIAGFYSAKIHSMVMERNQWEPGVISRKFDEKNYGGNMRDILLCKDGEHAWVSNLGRNMLHRFDIGSMEFVDSFLVGRKPNAIRFLDKEERMLLVSCRGENVVCFFDTIENKVIGVSEEIIGAPTGLCVVNDGNAFLATRFSDGVLEYHLIK